MKAICIDCGREMTWGKPCKTCNQAPPTFEQLKEDIAKAADRVFARGHLAGLQEAITEVRAFRIAAEAYAPNLATEVIRYRADALVDNLVTRAALLAKQIECGG